MDQIETHMTNVPETSKRRKLLTSNEKEKVQKNKIRTFQSNLAKKKYLLNFKRWPIFDFLDPEFILQIHMAMVFKDEGVLIVTRDKTVYAFGHNMNKQLGIGCTSMTLQPEKVEVLCGKNIKKFVSWNKGSRIMALTKEGEVYSWGYDEEELKQIRNSCDDHVRKGLTIPTQMSLLRRKHIIDIKCSITHCLGLTDDGKVYMWGYSEIKDLNNINYKIEPETYFSIDIEQIHFSGKKIISIACGSLFSMAVSNEGKLYSWGQNIDGALGIVTLPNTHDLYTYRVTSLSNKVIDKVICGFAHTVALTNKGKIYIWGSNEYGQLGLDQKVLKALYPILLDMTKMKRVLDIAIKQGSYGNCERNIALCDDGCIYMWGGICFVWHLRHPIITPFSNMHEALMFNDLPLMIFADNLKYMDGELDILECWETLFDNPSTSDLTIQIEGQSIHVHKAILKSRSSYFRTMFQDDSIENNQSVIQHSKYSYIVYKAFLKYLYTDVIDLSIERLLELLDIAIVYCESKLERYCIQEIKRGITIQNVALLCSTAEKYNKEDLVKFCLHFESRNS